MKKRFLKALGSFFLILSLVSTGGSEARAFQVTSGRGTLILMLRLPKGYEFIAGAPFALETLSASRDVVSFPAPPPRHFNPVNGHTKIPFATRPGKTLVTIRAKLFYCNKTSKMCFQNTREARLTIEIAPNGPNIIFYIWDVLPEMNAR